MGLVGSEMCIRDRPDGLREVPLEQGVEQYRAVNEGTCEKIILVP
ncbi:hypothetical protein OE419_28905, partial [Pseudomonas aeruginosa]|nr:hypothetical protein [Pseudomonas aeruginosa]